MYIIDAKLFMEKYEPHITSLLKEAIHGNTMKIDDNEVAFLRKRRYDYYCSKCNYSQNYRFARCINCGRVMIQIC